MKMLNSQWYIPVPENETLRKDGNSPSQLVVRWLVGLINNTLGRAQYDRQARTSASDYLTILAPLPIIPIPPLPACKLCRTISSAAAAAANLSFCLLRSRKYRSASGRILRIRRIMSSLGSAWISFLFSSLALFMVPRLRLIMMLLERLVLGSAAKMLLLAAPPIAPKVGGAEKRLRRAAASC